MPISSKRRLVQAAALSLLALASTTTLADGWPTKPVRMIVPAGAGAAPDVIARILGEKLAATWGQGVVVDNRPGAGGIPGMSALAKSAPDGYTIGFVPAAMGTITPLVFKNPQFNPDTELSSAATIGISPLMLAVPGQQQHPLGGRPGQDRQGQPRQAQLRRAAAQLPAAPGRRDGEQGRHHGPVHRALPRHRRLPPRPCIAGDATLTADGIPGLLPHIKSRPAEARIGRHLGPGGCRGMDAPAGGRHLPRL